MSQKANRIQVIRGPGFVQQDIQAQVERRRAAKKRRSDDGGGGPSAARADANSFPSAAFATPASTESNDKIAVEAARLSNSKIQAALATEKAQPVEVKGSGPAAATGGAAKMIP